MLVFRLNFQIKKNLFKKSKEKKLTEEMIFAVWSEEGRRKFIYFTLWGHAEEEEKEEERKKEKNKRKKKEAEEDEKEEGRGK